MREFALPGTRAQYAPDRICAARHYRLELDLDVADRRVDGTASIRLEALVDGDRSLTLDAVDLEVRTVRRDGRALEFHADGARLHVPLDGLRVGAALELA